LRTTSNTKTSTTIRHFRTGQTLFEGKFKDIRHAVETAIAEGISLAFADLRHTNLINAQMDGAILDGAQLDEANLMGANISESSLRRASLINTHMHCTTLCESILDSVNACGALFDGADISCATIQRCTFDTLSALNLNYCDADKIKLNGFLAEQNILCEFSHPPLVIKGLRYQITRLDRQFLIGHHAMTFMPENSIPEHGLYNFTTAHHTLIQGMLNDRILGDDILYGT